VSDPLPLDRYPHIEFGSVTPAVVTLSPAVKSVTAAAVTLSSTDRVMNCVMCGAELGTRWSRRAHVKTCSDKCRKAASRRKEAIAREVQRVRGALAALERYSDQWPDLHWDIMRAIGACTIEGSATSRRVVVKGDK
jgi:hypothetical protein